MRSLFFPQGVHFGAATLVATSMLLGACEDTMSPVAPDAAAILAEGTGGSDEVLTAELALWRETLPEEAFVLEFEGYANPAEGIFEVRILEPEEWVLLDPAAEEAYRTQRQGLNDYCWSLVTPGVVDTVYLETLTATIAEDDDCPTWHDEAILPSSYNSANRAFCATVRITSFWEEPINNLYAEIVSVAPEEFAMYPNVFRTTFGLGNGAEVPEGGHRGPTDDNGGLVSYGNFTTGLSIEEWWVFQRPSDVDFFFNGVIPYLRAEVDNDIDDDCDGLIDEDTGSYPDGDECLNDLDCEGGACDCSGAPCGEDEIATCRTIICGDGLVEGIEVCDNGSGAGVDSAVCDFDCTAVLCGDGHANTSAGEVCDPGAVGTYSSTCNIDCTAPSCGDGLHNAPAGEGCDDANLDNADGCLNSCDVAICGDSVVRSDQPFGSPGFEECDLGPGANGVNSGCPNCITATCGDGYIRSDITNSADPNFEECDGTGVGVGGVSASCDQDCSFAACGDGLWNVLAGESCDEGGNAVDCDSDCTTPLCGDGLTNGAYTPPGGRGPEQCDNGLANSSQAACTGDCRDAYCGDGFRRLDIPNPTTPGYEECDAGGSNSDATPNACRTNCLSAYCGDNVVDTGEVCDDGAGNSNTTPDACRTTCTVAGCGDGAIDTGEECDLGLAGNSNTLADTCRLTCVNPYCGDNVIDTGEVCDDSNNDDNDACRPDCSAANVCGDGNTNTGVEGCDDGNTTAGDGCNAGCSIESGWSCPPLGGACSPICGDGFVRGSEACDDSNLTDNDGCDSSCEVEPGWTCPGGTGCFTTCGDGIRAGAEACDSLALPTASCNNNCTTSSCGDTLVNPAAGETCDDGNSSNNDDCLNNCVANVCSDGWIRIGVEQCDGDGAGGAGQTASCDYIGGGNPQDCTAQACGDGYRNPLSAEQCDNGGSNSDTAPDACRTDCVNPICGDDVVDTGEACDFDNSDSAPNRCRTNCQPAFCGDGVVDTGEQCDFTGVNGLGQRCEGCVLDRDGDGFTVSEGDCNDLSASYNPAANDSVYMDNLDLDCDGFPGDASDTDFRLVAASCSLNPFPSGRCYTGSNALRNAINASSSGDVVFVSGNITVGAPVNMKNGVDVIGGYRTTGYDPAAACPSGTSCIGWSPSVRSRVQYNTNGTREFQAAVYGGGLSSSTEIAYLDIYTRRSAGWDVRSLHGASFGNSDGLYLHHNTIRAGAGATGQNTNQGDIDWPGSFNDCARVGIDCVANGNQGQGNGWEAYCPASHDAYFVKTNSALDGGGGGGASIGLMLANSASAEVTDNRITAGNGGTGGSWGGRGGQGGPSVSVWFYGETVGGWAYSNGENGAPVDCNATPTGSVLTFGARGSGGTGNGVGAGSYQTGRPGFNGRCHIQNNIHEYFYDCHSQGTSNLRSTSTPSAQSFPSYRGACGP